MIQITNKNKRKITHNLALPEKTKVILFKGFTSHPGLYFL